MSAATSPLNAPSTHLKRIFRAAADASVTSKDIGVLLGNVPDLPDRLKRWVKLYYGYLGGDLSDPVRAAVVLGPRAILDVAMQHALVDMMEGTWHPRAFRLALWTEALRRAVTARAIADYLGDLPSDTAFVAALACELGVVPLMENNNQALDWARSVRRLSGEKRIEAEKKLFGRNHVDGFVRLGRQWEFPESVLYLVANHHDPDRHHPDVAASLVKCLFLADLLAEAFVAERPSKAIDAWVEEAGAVAGVDPASAMNLVDEVLQKIPLVAQAMSVEIERQPTLDELNRGTVPSADGMSQQELLEWTRVLTEENEKARQIKENLERDLEAARLHDPLTGLPNHAMFLRALTRELTQARERSSPLVVMLADLDEFTRLCGHVGYDVGDQVLTSLGEGLRRVWRDASEVARVGPDAFAAVFAVDERAGRLIAERTRAAVEASKADIRGQRLRFTATICGVSLETLPSNADANALYAALMRLHVENRRQGGNRTVW